MLSELPFPHIRCCLSAILSDLMKSTAVDESLSSMNQQFCSRENQLLQMLQQNEKSTQNYLSKFSSVTTDVFEPLSKLTSVKADWTWNRIYQHLYDRAKKIIKKDPCIEFYDASRPLYLEIDASDVSLGVRLHAGIRWHELWV